jgi:hypothetical protein
MTLRTEQELTESAYRLALARRSSRGLLLDPDQAAATPRRLNRSTPIHTILQFTCRALGARLAGELEAFWQSVGFADLSCDNTLDQFAFFLKCRVENGTIRIHYLPELIDFELTCNELRFLPRRELLAHADGGIPLTRDAGLTLHPLVRVQRFPCDAEGLFATLCPSPTAHARSVHNRRRESFLLLSVLKQASPEVYQLEPRLGRRLWVLQNVGTFAGSAPELQTLAGLGVVVRSH